MRIVPPLMVVILGVAALGCSVAVQAQTCEERLVKPITAEVPSANMQELEAKLRVMILRAQPGAKIELKGNSLTASYRGARYKTHLGDGLTGEDYVEGTGANEFPSDFAEFSLELIEEKDIMHYRPDSTWTYRVEPFGTTLRTRANLRQLLLRGDDFDKVPFGHWAYSYIGWPERSPVDKWIGNPSPLSRYEFALQTIRFREQFPSKQRVTSLKWGVDIFGLATEVTHLSELESEFAPEILWLSTEREKNVDKEIGPLRPQINGLAWQPRYEYLSLWFSYGKGVDAGLVESIRQLVMGYSTSAH